nr:8-oxo-dGTP diphosphatase MutT [Legionella spiritensis]
MRVAVAVIRDKNHRILITRRALHDSHGGFWEFPGGKLEDGEDARQALYREIREEVGIEIITSHFLGDINHQYENKSVTLSIFMVEHFKGHAQCLESQIDLRWVDQAELPGYQFPAANYAIFSLIDNAMVDSESV